ncbi:5-bromo-4-chloroindolyl phosphate hydrolysis family protein [Planococcus sp. MB-3u-03]|uniref:5-bromo-4-chloroindolyl phosphate hydrolysis family protein n=1 Tax=Planococcus sp. MB-3u-03 TaxID=2058136 RepID=UPI001E2C22FB|nr:5-bromo-4-chloroindolyl phosphate hydrolysis family protein [Planococcus sp. MB-3u-03]
MKPIKPIENFIKDNRSASSYVRHVPDSLFRAEIGLLASGAVAAGTYFASNTSMKQYQLSSDSKQLGMTRSEYRNIRVQIKEGKEKSKPCKANIIKYDPSPLSSN